MLTAKEARSLTEVGKGAAAKPASHRIDADGRAAGGDAASAS
jgi:hypothetical protein